MVQIIIKRESSTTALPFYAEYSLSSKNSCIMLSFKAVYSGEFRLWLMQPMNL